jgi:RNA polymerase sigma factor (sigma-70 family)
VPPAGNRADQLQRVYREQVGAVFAFFAYSVSSEVAEDLTSATFERVIRRWRSYDAERGSERTWILAIARNLLVDHFRRRSHRDAVSTEQHPVLLNVRAVEGDPLEAALAADELRAWLARLGERERQILALRYAADLTGAQIAEVVGLSPGNVHQILSRSLRKLRADAERERVSGSAAPAAAPAGARSAARDRPARSA